MVLDPNPDSRLQHSKPTRITIHSDDEFIEEIYTDKENEIQTDNNETLDSSTYL